MKIISIAGKFVHHDRIFKATVYVDQDTGLITCVGPHTHDADIVFPENCLIFPGFLDVHTHGREDATGEESYKEDFHTLGLAAANGGVVHVAEMGNNPKPPVDDDSYEEKETLTARSSVPVTLYAMIGPRTDPLRRNVPYKLCHARTTGKNDVIFFGSKKEIIQTAERYKGKHVSQHCEDTEILAKFLGELLHENKRPAMAEVSSIALAIQLIEEYFGAGKLCHCSVMRGLDVIVAAKKRGVKVTCEVTPHHLYFDTSMITDENRVWMQMNPPLRPPADRLACIKALKSGDIDMIATDHAPHTTVDKRKGASGQPHLDTLGPFTTWLMTKHFFTPEDISRVCSYAPSLFLNQFLPESYGKGYGLVEPGRVGSFTVIDPNKPITIHKGMLKTKCNWSPFDGITFPGSVRSTIVRGMVLK